MPKTNFRISSKLSAKELGLKLIDWSEGSGILFNVGTKLFERRPIHTREIEKASLELVNLGQDHLASELEHKASQALDELYGVETGSNPDLKEVEETPVPEIGQIKEENKETPEEYENAFEYHWLYDSIPVFDPSAAVATEKEAGRPIAFNPEDAEEGPKQIGWSDQMALSYNAAYMEKGKLIQNLRQYAALVQKRSRKGESKWTRMLNEAADWLERGKGEPYWTTFNRGNTKLPFFEWSVVAAGTCPGAGACLNFCYSIKFWFRENVYRRQLMNTLLLRFHPEIVREEFMQLKFGKALPFMRLHVHGDFQDSQSVEFWMKTIAARPDVSVYAYSKSWNLLLEYDQKSGGKWPENFILNLSSGSKYGESVRERMEKLACARGNFVALDLTKEEGKLVQEIESGEIGKSAVMQAFIKEHGGVAREKLKPEHMEILGSIRKSALSKVLQKRYTGTGKKIFACPGFCATCTKVPGGFAHACGSKKFRGVDIAIGIH